MGEYVFVEVYKNMGIREKIRNTFEATCWKLLDAGDDQKKIEEIYKSIGFVNPHNNSIFDLMMRFMERDGIHYQTNSGVLGSDELPNLFLEYKWHFHDFWLSILKPSELSMDEYNGINAEITGKTLHNRFSQIEKYNNRSKHFKESDIYNLYYTSTKWQPSLSKIINDNDIIKIAVGQIYGNEVDGYRENARKLITKQRKEIIDKVYIPHWVKAN